LEVLDPGQPIAWLTTVGERHRLLREAGAQIVVPVSFTRDVSRLRAAEFAALLQRHLGMRGLVVGPNFALGYNREGTPDYLALLGKERGFTVKVADAYSDVGEQISSTTIRMALSRGDVTAASRLLGYRYALVGEIARGTGRGDSVLGYPTANIAVDAGIALPSDGIYATWAYVDHVRYNAATSIGVRPTFGPGERAIEAFILDFKGDLYGKKLRLEFVERLRDEVSFSSAEALRAQIDADVEQTRRRLSAFR